MRAFGMTPVLPAFAGFVPEALAEKYPGVSIKRSSNWCHFPEPFCCVRLLDPLEPLFTEIGSEFVKVQLSWASFFQHCPVTAHTSDVDSRGWQMCRHGSLRLLFIAPTNAQ